MNVTLPEKEKLKKRTIAIYVTVAIICILAIIIVIGIEVLGDDIVDNIFGINKIIKRTEQEEAKLKSDFEDIFKNKLENEQNYNTKKIKEDKELVYTSYKKEEKADQYEINVNLPYINIENEIIQDFNKEISDIFEAKSEEVLKNTEQNVIYTVKYEANIENNVLSVIIYSNLKQGISAQRVIIQTFNFDLENNKKLSLENIIKIYDLNNKEVQNKINEDIKEEQRRADDLKALGYNVFSRDLNSEIYKIENINEFFIYNNNIYIIFAYGNDNLTSEMDLVII